MRDLLTTALGLVLLGMIAPATWVGILVFVNVLINILT